MNNNDKFIWKSDDIKIMTEAEFSENAIMYNSKTGICAKNVHCVKCDNDQKRIATQIASNIFNTFFVSQPYDESIFRRVMKNLSSLCKKATEGKCALTKELYYCIKSILISEIQEKTTIRITPKMIDELLK